MREFIKNNHLSFGEGRRNSTVTLLVSYSQHLGWTKEQLKEEVKKEIDEDFFIEEEIERLWDYCKNRNYKDYWTKPEAKLQYKF